MTSLNQITRRQFLRYVGYGAAATVVAPALGPLLRPAGAGATGLTSLALWEIPWEAVPYPVPLPGDPGDPTEDTRRLARFTVVDDVVLPQGLRYEVVAKWGDRFGPADEPEHQIVFGYNADFVALFPTPVDGEFWLFVNHEYVSAMPWLQGYAEVYGEELHRNGFVQDFRLSGGKADLRRAPPAPDVAEGLRKICRAALADVGVSVLRVRREPDGGYRVVADARDHRRIHAFGRQNIAPETPLEMTGPAVALGITVRGTLANCSGGVTPWGTALTCEENFQDQTTEAVSPAGLSVEEEEPAFFADRDGGGPDLPHDFYGLCNGLDPAVDPRGYGWVCEVDPATGALWKHSALGRFRHENVALRVEPGKPLAAYMGDDRRGGHVWKFVSAEPVKDPRDPANRRLFERGTLYVARFEPDFNGRWIPLKAETPLRPVRPEQCADHLVSLPRRPAGGWVVVDSAEAFEAWRQSVEAFCGKPLSEMTLKDLVAPDAPVDAVLMLDAFLMANAAGGTPCARPEDLEVHPLDQSVYIAFTDSTGDEYGAPDHQIFPDSRRLNSRQYGAIYRLLEDGNDPAAETFKWGKFVSAGECAEGGGGFACADNLAFDPAGNLWMVTDITTNSLNFPVNRQGKTAPGEKRFPGVFGNNAMFFIPTAGPEAGAPKCFATGPMECEFTGPCFTPEGWMLIAVQHPGEGCGTRGDPASPEPLEEERDIHILGRDGRVFVQKRRVPLGSNFPFGRAGAVPRPAVICIRPETA